MESVRARTGEVEKLRLASPGPATFDEISAAAARLAADAAAEGLPRCAGL